MKQIVLLIGKRPDDANHILHFNLSVLSSSHILSCYSFYLIFQPHFIQIKQIVPLFGKGPDDANLYLTFSSFWGHAATRNINQPKTYHLNFLFYSPLLERRPTMQIIYYTFTFPRIWPKKVLFKLKFIILLES